MTDTTLRQLKLLEFIPRQPFKKSPQLLKDDLSQIGFNVSIRTIQRDLKVLSSILPLISDERDKPYGWSWHKNSPGLNPAMDPIEALTFSLAEEYLEPIMPSKSFNRLKIFFDRANNVLKEMDKSSIKKWRDNVRVVPQWQTLIAPKINDQAESEIYDALLKGNQLEVLYLKRGEKKVQKRLVNPLGIIVQGVVHRLVCTLDDDIEQPRHLPMHRFQKAIQNGNKRIKPKDFKLDEFIKNHAESAYHPCGTCKMGSDTDKFAVVDPETKVIGVQNLRVVDSSVFPRITNGNLNAPSIMTGEKAADHILGRDLLSPSNVEPWINPNWKRSQR